MKQADVKPNFVKNEEEILKFWENNKIFEKVKEKNKKTNKYFAFLDGPVTANYPMGLHHALGRTLKDTEIRYKAMTGHDCHYQNGFDVHGLPMEVAVEKELGLNSKKEIEALGIDKFTEACMKKAEDCGKNMTDRSIRLGQWMNWDDSYYTNSDENIQGIWYFFKKCQENGWLKESYKPRPWCIRCGTTLSEHEMADGDAHKEVVHEAVFFLCPVLNKDFDMLVWTTTPWTLSSNVAIAVNPELNYAICSVKSRERKVVVCESATKVLKGDFKNITEIVKGSDLIGLSYETCFPQMKEQQFEHKIVGWEDVDASEGSGQVHIAPGCGAEDFELGQRLGLKNIMPIDESGYFYDGFDFLSGLNAGKDETRDLIFEKLNESGKLYYHHPYKHVYPHCWRCKQPLMFRLVKEWVIAVDGIREKLIEEAKNVVWQPAFYEKRMIDWLTNMGDWPISRKRYYGVPLPFYVCPKCGKITVVESKNELRELAVNKQLVDDLPHLHRPYIDEIEIVCPECGENVKRVMDVGDTWLDAGITPFSTKKYFTDKQFWERNYPVDFVCEAKEQIRLWFYSLLIMGVVITGKAPYKKVKTYGMLLAQDGKKLSKSSPNNIPLNEAFDKMGADIIRYNFVSSTMDGDVKFGFEVADEVRRKLLNFWNIYVFLNTYAVIDKPNLNNYNIDEETLNVTDKWVIERTNDFAINCKNAYENTSFNDVTNEFEKFIDDISNWYIRINRRRFWKGEDGVDKLNAYWCLMYAIKNICYCMAPILPFTTEYIWQNLVRELFNNEEESVFIKGFDIATYNLKKNYNLAYSTDVARLVIALGQRLRNENQIKIKQPLKTMYIIAADKEHTAIEDLSSIIKEELNIKEIVFEKDTTKFNIAYLTLNFSKAGAVLQKDVQTAKTILQNMSDDEMAICVADFDKGSVNIGEFKNLDSSLFNKNLKAKQDYVIGIDGGISVVLDITIDENLMFEGLSRELIRWIQVLRKEAGFKIEQRIDMQLDTQSETMKVVIEKYLEKIKNEALVKNIEINLEDFNYEKSVTIQGEDILIKLKKTESKS